MDDEIELLSSIRALLGWRWRFKLGRWDFTLTAWRNRSRRGPRKTRGFHGVLYRDVRIRCR